MPTLRYRRLATASLTGACAIAVGVALLGGGNRPAAAATATPAPAPSFSNLGRTGDGGLAPGARDALIHAGAPKDAPTTVSVHGEFTVAVVRGERTYLALINNVTQRATVVESPASEVDKRAGTWVAAGGSADGGKTTLAMLVPDGVDSIDVTDDDGAQTRADVTDNIGFIQRENLAAAEYQFGGTKRGADLVPRSHP